MRAQIEQVTPWLNLLTPALLALVMYVLTGINDNLLLIRAELVAAEQVLSNQGARIQGAETAIDIYHNQRNRREYRNLSEE